MDKLKITTEHPWLTQVTMAGYSYYRLDKMLLSPQFKAAGIGTNEAVLFTLIKDRLNLSVKNNWIDTDGKFYVLFSRATAIEKLGWCKSKVLKTFSNLSEAGLIREEEQLHPDGRTAANRLYIRIWNLGPENNIDFNNLKNITLPEASKKLTEESGSFYVIPKILLEDDRYHGLSLNSILLYTDIIDSLRLSEDYGRVDENGLTWTLMNAERTIKLLGITKNTVTKLYTELEEAGLIHRQKVGSMNATKVYARDFIPRSNLPELNPDGYDEENKNIVRAEESCLQDVKANPKKQTPESQKTDPQFPKNEPPNPKKQTQIRIISNNNDINKNHYQQASELASEPMQTGCKLPFSKEEIAYTDLAKAIVHQKAVENIISKLHDSVEASLLQSTLASCFSVVLDLLTTKDRQIYISGSCYSKQQVIETLKTLSDAEVYEVVVHVNRIMQEDSILDTDAYIKAALFRGHQQHHGSAYYLCEQYGIRDGKYIEPKTKEQLEIDEIGIMRKQILSSVDGLTDLLAVLELDLNDALNSTTPEDKERWVKRYSKDYEKLRNALKNADFPELCAEKYLNVKEKPFSDMKAV